MMCKWKSSKAMILLVNIYGKLQFAVSTSRKKKSLKKRGGEEEKKMGRIFLTVNEISALIAVHLERLLLYQLINPSTPRSD